MNQEEKDKWIALIEGVAAGRQLQRYYYSGGPWETEETIDLRVDVETYRLKPVEPRSVEARISNDIFNPECTGPSQACKGEGIYGVRVRITEIL